MKLAEVEGALSAVKNGVNRAISGAINKTTSKAGTFVKRGFVELLTAKSSALKKRLYTTKANPGKLEGSVRIQARPMGLANFQLTEDRKKKGWGTAASGTGVKVRVRRDGPVIVLPRAFVAKLQYGNIHVTQRKVFGGKIGTKAGRAPLAAQYSERLGAIYETSPLKNKTNEFLAAEFPKQLDSQISRLLAGR